MLRLKQQAVFRGCWVKDGKRGQDGHAGEVRDTFAYTRAALPRAGLPRSTQSRSTMSKLMILFVLFVSGSLYDPPRVLNHLGPGAAALGWHIKTTFSFR